MSNDRQSLVTNITRYGLPIVVGIFYLTASLGFDYTSESTFQLTSIVRSGATFSGEGFPSPLWQFILTLGSWLHLNTLLASKVLSLVFSCVAILVTYLIANEVLRDRLIAFCVSLAMAMQGWLLQTAPSGSALTLAITLTLAGLFFTLRNEYVVAPFMFGLCTLVFWQAVFLLVPLCLDIWMNSVSKQRSVKVVLSGCIVYLSALLPWVLYVWKNDVNGLPILLQVSELPQVSFPSWIVITVLLAIACSGFVVGVRFSQDRMETVRTNIGVMIFVIILAFLGIVYHAEVWIAVIPIIATYAFSGIAELLKRLGRPHVLYGTSLMLTGLLLVHLQFDYYRWNKAAMGAAIGRAGELRIVGEWLKLNSVVSHTVCAERPFALAYCAERPVALIGNHDESCGDLIVTSRREVAGYDVVFTPEPVHESSGIPLEHYTVWRRR